MPRITRAAFRSNAVTENLDLATLVSLPPTPHKERAPLGEIAGNAVEDVLNKSNPNDVDQPQKKASAKTKKGRAPKKATPENNAIDDIHTEVLEDDNLSATSSAVEEACEELLKDNSPGSPQSVLPDKEIDAPASLETDAHQNNSSHDSTAHGPDTSHTSEDFEDANGKEDDSFVNSIKIRTPAKMTNTAEPPIPNGAEIKQSETSQVLDRSSTKEKGSRKDSFVDKIVTRTPAKSVTRIEDSVEAIDAFEEEIEKVGDLIPTISDTVTPVKAKTSRRDVTKKAAPRSGSTGLTKRTRSKAATITVAPKSRDAEKAGSKISAQSAPFPAKKNDQVVKPESNKAPPNPTKRISSIYKAPFQPAKSTKPPTQSTFELPGDAVAQKLKERREERLRAEHEGGGKKVEMKPPSKPVKSTKPLTRPTFELPGDAVARKLKEQREQRIKQQDAGTVPEEKKAFKARPVRLSQAPAVKGNASSKARMSLAKMDSTANKSPQDHAPTIRPAIKRPASVVPTDDKKRLSLLSVAKRTPRPSTAASARVTRGPSLAAADPSRLSTTAVATQRITSDGKTAHQTIRGREVFERGRSAKEEQDRLRKEKEEAAKKARADAAERGRMASRQWAEKQKARKASAEKGVENSAVAAEA